MPHTTLALFDIDGTLTTGSICGRIALESALERVLGVREALSTVSLHGSVDWLVVREVALGCGAWPGDRDAQRRLVTDVLEEYRALFDTQVTTMPYRALPSAEDAVIAARGACEMVGLATGNVESCAHSKLRSAGLGALFEGCIGGFGDDEADTRADLVRAAVSRARGRGAQAARVVVIGDTPRDIAAAHDAGAQGYGVATGNYGVDALLAVGALRAFPDLTELLRDPPWR